MLVILDDTKMTTDFYRRKSICKNERNIELAQTDKKEASKRLQTYMEKNGLKVIMIMNGKMHIKNLDM